MKSKQILSLLLALLMLFSVLPLPGFAEPVSGEETEAIIEEIYEKVEMNEQEDTEDFQDDSWEEEATEDEIPDAPDIESDVPDESDTDDGQDDPGAEDDASDWYADDSPEDEPDDGWPEAEDEAETEEMEEDPSLTWEEEIDLLYEGSLIRYAIDYDGYAYVKTAQPVTVYGDSRMNADSELCKITQSDAVLLATGFDTESGSNTAIRVWFVTKDMEPVEGFVRESSLWNDVLIASDVDRLCVEQDYLLVQVYADYLPIFVAETDIAEETESIEAPDSTEDVPEPAEEAFDFAEEGTDLAEEAEPLSDDDETLEGNGRPCPGGNGRNR